VKERPIILSGPEVRAVLSGAKTQMRIPIRKPEQYTRIRDCAFCCPHGAPGDRLWIRETFTLESTFNMEPYDPPFTDGRPIKHFSDEAYGDYWNQPHYRATEPDPELSCDSCSETCNMNGEPHSHWTPSIHMPRWASRILLEIIDVQVQRLHEITAEDAIKEGVNPTEIPGIYGAESLLHEYMNQWNAKHSKRAPWDSNPFVWCITFRRIE
jgi:hypothetical protein